MPVGRTGAGPGQADQVAQFARRLSGAGDAGGELDDLRARSQLTAGSRWRGIEERRRGRANAWAYSSTKVDRAEEDDGNQPAFPGSPVGAEEQQALEILVTGARANWRIRTSSPGRRPTVRSGPGQYRLAEGLADEFEFKLPMMIILARPGTFLDRVTDRTLFLRADGVHAFKTSFSHAREELLRRDAASAVQRRLEDKEVRRLEQAAARYKVWAIKNPGAEQAQERHRDPRRPHRGQPHPGLQGARAAAGAVRRRDRGQGRPADREPERHHAGRRAHPDEDRPLRARGRRQGGAAGRQRRRQVDPADGAVRGLSRARSALRRPGAGAVQSGHAAGLLRPGDERPAARRLTRRATWRRSPA